MAEFAVWRVRRDLIRWARRSGKVLREARMPLWLGILILVAVAGLAVTNAILLRRLGSTSPEGERRFATATSVRRTSRAPTLVSQSSSGSRPRATLTRGVLTLEGVAEGNCIVAFVADGELRDVQLTKAGKFRFADFRLHRGLNRVTLLSLSLDGSADTLGSLEFTYGIPSLEYLARSFDRGAVSLRRVALTFDGGSLNNVGEEILDYLQQEGVRATFFLTGEFIRRYPETVRRIVREGHQVGNHTWSHPHLTTWELNRRHQTRGGVTREMLRRELEETARLFEKTTGQKMSPYWRAPYGEHNAEIRRWAAELGYRHVGWTVGKDLNHTLDTLDWVADASSPVYFTADQIVERILSLASEEPHGANGAVILMHMGSQRTRDFPHRKLPEIIRGLRSMGYQFVTVEEMFP